MDLWCAARSQGLNDGAYFVPETCDSQSACIEYIQSLPIATDPSVFGLHGSADITFRANASEDLLQKIVTASHTHAAAKAETRSADNAMVLDLAERISAELGKPLVVHTRAAEEDTLTLMIEHLSAQHPVHLHCFTGSTTLATNLLNHFPQLSE